MRAPPRGAESWRFDGKMGQIAPVHGVIADAPRKQTAGYASPILSFLERSDAEVLGSLTAASQFDVELSQRDAWAGQLGLLRVALAGLDGWLYLEFDVPRLGSRIDAVVVVASAVMPIEFKVGRGGYHRADYEQAWDYGLDLKNFHAASHAADILPILVATDAPAPDSGWLSAHADGVRPPRRCNAKALPGVVREGLALARGIPLDGAAWGRAPYRPTPSIIEAARALYQRHSVDSIARNDAGAINLHTTSHRVEEIIDEVRRAGAKAIVFVTGVPGAGKTLVGLNVATRRRQAGDTHAVYLSGNGPLVDVLREALTRDEFVRRQARGEKVRKGTVAQPVKAFIQNVHHFRDEGVRDEMRPPADHVVIFDESQRAWNREKTEKFMRQRKARPGFLHSEPEVLLGYMDRHPQWAVVICLVGGGQEINEGEAGIEAWLDTVRIEFPGWDVYVSPNLRDSEYAAGGAIAALEKKGRIRSEPDLHLAVSMRSFRAEHVSGFVKAVLDSDEAVARDRLTSFQSRYPIAVTRDLSRARRWLRYNARGSERVGLVTSSQAKRLKPHAIDVRVSINPVHYFLHDSTDTRSSSFLEDAATEFQVQGLELDWVCVTWDADLRRRGGKWSHHGFRGNAWQNVRKPDRQRYLVNAYRVLLTRARQGMVVFVPPGDADDPTRLPEYYDETYAYLVTLGLAEVA